MAVSESKLSDLSGSISVGSAEDFDNSCEPCLTIGQHVEAHGFCVECQEYLCRNCFECHKRTKASRNHQLLNKENVGKHVITNKNVEECTEKCEVHKEETIKFFCPTHQALGCNDCIILDHRNCKIDYILEKCVDIADSEEYMDTLETLKEKMKDTEDVMKKAEKRDKEIDKFHASIIQEILHFRKEINERQDQLQQDIQKEAAQKKSNDKQIIQMVLDQCSNISSDIKKVQSSLQPIKTSKQNGQLYINMKRAECKLKFDEVKKADEFLAKTNMQYLFERSIDLDKCLSKHNVFGKLNPSACVSNPKTKKTLKSITHKEEIDVKTKSDGHLNCYITGCAVLSSDKIVLADNNKCKLKVVERHSKIVTEEKKLYSNPFAIAVLPEDQLAVTVPEKKEILIMKTDGKLTTVCTVPVRCGCYGITLHQDHLYVVCKKPNGVLVHDTQGKDVQYTISLNNDVFNDPRYIVVSDDSRHIYISDIGSNCIVRITLQGDVSAVYKHEKLRGPLGVLMLADGSLLACSYWNSNIHHISGDFNQGQTMIDDIPGLSSISYSHQHKEVYIGCDGDQLKVFSMK